MKVQTLGEKQRTLATLDMSMNEIEDVDKMFIIHYIICRCENYAR